MADLVGKSGSGRSLSDSETKETRGDHGLEQLTHSFHHLTPPSAPHELEQSLSSPPKRTTWYDLPSEILVCIAKKVIVPQESTEDDQYPHFDEIETNFGAIDRRTRRAFSDAIQQEYLFIRLEFYNGRKSGMNRDFRESLQRYFFSSRYENLLNMTRSISGNITTSILRVQFHENLEFGARRTGKVVFCATPWNLTLMRSFLVAQRSLYPNLIIDGYSSRQSSTNLMRSITQDMEKVTRGMTYVGLFTTSNVMPVMETSVLSAQMMQQLDYSAKFIIHENHLSSLREAIKYKDIQKILPYAAEAAVDHVRCFRRINVLRLPDPRVARQRALYVTLVLKSFAAYLWLQPNTREQQSHCLFTSEPHGDKLLRECLVCTSKAKNRLDRIGWAFTNKDTELLLRAVFGMLQARAEYELALARTATLPSAFMISSHIQRSEMHRLGKLDFSHHLALAGEVRRTLLNLYEARLDWEPELSRDLAIFQQWSDIMTVLTFETESATARPARQMLQRGILEEPVLQGCIESLQCTLVFSEDD